MATTQQDEQRMTHAPAPPRSSTWRVELVVAFLGMILGLATAVMLLG